MIHIRGPLLALAFLATAAQAHQAGPLMPPGVQAQVVQEFPKISPIQPAGAQPKGWTYPWACCSGMDCAEIPQTSVHETSEGYVVDGATDDAPISYQDKRVKDSPDGAFHWCAHRTGPDLGKTICLFAPPRGY
jgi:hypothetical protein